MEITKQTFTKTKIAVFLLMCIGLFLALYFNIGPKTAMKKGNSNEVPKGFAVVELFTSEGCEHCPPAHDLVARIQQEHPNKEVYVLAYHVDFWDNKRWKDKFSNAAFSRRQISYANWLNVPQVYAPQIVVNGKSEFGGTAASNIRSSIAEVLAKPSKANLSIQSNQVGDKLILNYQVSGVSKDRRLLIAIVQKSSKGQVEEGKDKGHQFRHFQTVRGLHTESLTNNGKGSTTIRLPEGFNSSEWEVIAMIQDIDKTGEISTATRVNF